MDPGNQQNLPPQQPVTPPNVPPQPAAGSVQPAPMPAQPAPQVVQPEAPPQAVPAPQPMTTPAPMGTQGGSIQDNMRSTILKIIGALSALSLGVVFLLFIVSGSADSTLTETAQASNDQATYTVPASWSEDNVGTFAAYYNRETLESSQATFLVVEPVRVSFDESRIADEEIQKLAEDYRRTVNDGETNISLADGVEVQVEGFYKAYDFEVTGLADDGITEVRGLSRILFDETNFAHTIEFVAIRGYWEVNETEIRSLIDSYTLQTGE